MVDTRQIITNYAKNILLIDEIGFSSSDIPKEDILNYRDFLDENDTGDMTWLRTRQSLRENPKLLFGDLNTVIVLGSNYFADNKQQRDYEISKYADQKQDYHQWLYYKIGRLVKFIANRFNKKSRYFVDSAPVLEKVFAKQTAIGWQGKHTCIVSPRFGSWLFLGVIFSEIVIDEFDTPHKDLCGTCRKCIDACPTGALSPYKIDPNKCIAYFTIEHKGIIDNKLSAHFQDKLFGCDECLKACHFNKWQHQSNLEIIRSNNLYPHTLLELLRINRKNFKRIFLDTPVQRTGYERLMRNALIVLKNNFRVYKEQFDDFKSLLIILCSYPNQVVSNLAYEIIAMYIASSADNDT